ncbi:hypothetical protein BDW60DRAFT_211395 [Aspergillus nidulans var. acristatus]
MAPRHYKTPSKSGSRRLLRQKRDRRRLTLTHKVYEYSRMCDADIYLGIRIRDTGKVFTVSIDPTGFWSFLHPQLDQYYPKPVRITETDLEGKGWIRK